jgi:hypothetical protein
MLFLLSNVEAFHSRLKFTICGLVGLMTSAHFFELKHLCNYS